MNRNTLRKQRRTQLAILLSLLLTAPLGVKNCWGQAAGFAQSRAESAATAESGSRRSFLSSLNPFSRQSDSSAPIVDSTTISQPVATNQPPASLVVPRTLGSTTPVTTPNPQYSAAPRTSANLPAPAQQAPPKVALSRSSSVPTASALPSSTSAARSVRSSLAGRSGSSGSALGVSSAKSTSTGGVASLLLDELEEDFDEPVSKELSTDPAPKTERRSLRSDSFPASLELLSEDDEEEETPVTKNKSKKNVISTEEDDELLDEEEEDELLTDDSDDDELLEELEEDESEDAPLVDVVVSAPSKNAKKSAAASEKKSTAKKANDKPSRLSDLEEAELLSRDDEIEVEDVDVESLDNRLESVLVQDESAVRRSVPAPKNDVQASGDSLSKGRTPNIETSTVGPRKLTVGQPSTYTIRVKNVGSETARKLVVTTELPDYVVNLKSSPSLGDASFMAGGERNVAKRCVWKVGVLNPGEEQTLALTLTPTKRAAFALASSFDFERPAACAEVEVQEPILEALIEGRDSIEWGVEDRYRLRLRNIGNGDAENVTLNVTTDENSATQRIGVLRAGEEKTIEMSVKTVSEDFFTINVHAVGAYGLEAKATKKVSTLRGKINVAVETPDLQFVEGEFEAIIHVRNSGNATLQNVDVVAQLPSGVEALSCSNQARRNDEKRRVYWVAPFVRPNEEISFSVMCRVTAAGLAKFEAVAVDQSGLVAQARSEVNVESIAVLAMRVNAPKEPVAVGRTCVYELVVENNGTRDAHDINTGIFLGSGMKPLAVEDGRGYVYENDSKALFKKIDCLRAGDSVVFRVSAEALEPGNQKVQAMLQSASEDVSLLSEETTYCYARRSSGARENSLMGSQTMTAERTESGSVLK